MGPKTGNYAYHVNVKHYAFMWRWKNKDNVQ